MTRKLSAKNREMEEIAEKGVSAYTGRRTQ